MWKRSPLRIEANRAALFAATLSVVLGQAPAFEAASIKPNTSGRSGGGIDLSPGRIKIINSSLKLCVQVAWNVKDFQVSGAANWMDAEHYDIDAVAANPFTREEFRAMLQALLTDRFGLAIHREMQDKPGYALVVAKSVAAKNGPKLQHAAEDPSIQFSRTSSGDRTLKAPGLSMAQLASALSQVLGKTVVDQTGIEGIFNIALQWTPDPASEPRMAKNGEPMPSPPPDATPGPSIFTAVQETLGLKLESKKVPVEVIVIDRATRPTEN
jgi:uncharacterized protein (TIGR03435 family)